MITKNKQNTDLLPINESDRLQYLDIIRGIAILGILILNIPSFGLPERLAFSIYGFFCQGFINTTTWIITNTFFDGNMRGLFCLLFGAGIVLFSQQCERNNASIFPLYRRMLWLIVFAFFDIFILLWDGDILYEYAICGLILIPLRKLKPLYLILISLSILGYFIFQNLIDFKDGRQKYEQYSHLELHKNSKLKLTREQQKIKTDWETIGVNFQPFTSETLREYKKEIATEINSKKEKYKQSFIKNTENFKYFVDPELYLGFLLELIPMLLGMALFKLEWFTVNNRKRNLMLVFLGLFLGLAISIYTISTQPYSQESLNYFMKNTSIVRAFVYPFINPLVSLGLIGAILLFCSTNSFIKLKNGLAVTGRMAFTNYLMQSLICGLIFNGYGIGLFGQLQRYELFYVVFFVWIINISFSIWWLKHYYLGPMEWIWRMLTYMKYIPIKRTI